MLRGESGFGGWIFETSLILEKKQKNLETAISKKYGRLTVCFRECVLETFKQIYMSPKGHVFKGNWFWGLNFQSIWGACVCFWTVSYNIGFKPNCQTSCVLPCMGSWGFFAGLSLLGTSIKCHVVDSNWLWWLNFENHLKRLHLFSNCHFMHWFLRLFLWVCVYVVQENWLCGLNFRNIQGTNKEKWQKFLHLNQMTDFCVFRAWLFCGSNNGRYQIFVWIRETN